MEQLIIQEEILLVTDSSFFKKELNKINIQKSAARLSQREEIANCFWDGLMDSFLSKILSYCLPTAYRYKMYFHSLNHSIQIGLSESMTIGVLPPSGKKCNCIYPSYVIQLSHRN
jgi:hypothetical protein